MKNAYLAKLQAQKAQEMREVRLFTVKWCSDAAILAANEVFQRKGDKIAEFHEAFCRYAMEIAEMTVEDAKADKEMVYTKAKLDKRLFDILGEKYFVPWDERYGS